MSGAGSDRGYDILGEVLPAIDPAQLSYQEWLNVGFALKSGGFSAADWDAWSAGDSRRYHAGECERKWNSLSAEGGITLGTLIQYAREQGWIPERVRRAERSLDWDDEIGDDGDALRVLDAGAAEPHPLPRVFPEWNPAKELTRYLELLFDSTDIVAYCVETWERDGRYLPTKGIYTRTAGELISDIAAHGGDIGAVIGDAKPEAGAWIRFNPFDGQGVRNENVTDFRYALVESDSLPIEEQYALYTALELPIAAMVHSGGKSLHAIVHIDAGSLSEYRDRVSYLYRVCETNGLKIDTQNKNCSRLSRMPGVMRNGRQQYLVTEATGRANFEEWRDYIESVNDDMPDPENLAAVWDKMPELSPPLIAGVLRQGHKLLLAGPSKAGKSFALLELCVAIAEGRDWMGFQCAQGRVMYVNLELDRASCLHRLKDVYAALGWPPRNTSMIDLWNLRGAAVPLDKLAPRLIRRAQKKNYIAIVIDPIYKIITGDENSADQMAKFCNQFDLICSKLGCAVIYCHHHSKGAQGGKSAIDRASGSGVFARDPDALLDMIELPIDDARRKREGERAAIECCHAAMDKSIVGVKWDEALSQDDQCSAPRALEACRKLIAPYEFKMLESAIEAAKAKSDKKTAWRIEGTLREFERFPPINLWFDYPVHRADADGGLQDVEPETPNNRMERGRGKIKENNQKQRDGILNAIRMAVDFSQSGCVAIQDLDIPNKKGNLYETHKILEWFGDGKGARKLYKLEFEKFVGEDGRAYLRRKEAPNCEDDD